MQEMCRHISDRWLDEQWRCLAWTYIVTTGCCYGDLLAEKNYNYQFIWNSGDRGGQVVSWWLCNFMLLHDWYCCCCHCYCQRWWWFLFWLVCPYLFVLGESKLDLRSGYHYMRWFELAKRRSPLEWGDKTGGDVRIGMNYIPRNNNAMMMEKYCSGSLDARYARWRCTECKHKWERWIIGTTWMMTGKWREMDFSWQSSENKHKESERGGYAKEEIWWCCLKEVSKFISLQSCNFMNSPTFNGLNGLQVEWQVLFNAHFAVLIP